LFHTARVRAQVLVFVKGRMKLRITQPTRKERSAMLERSFTMYGSPPFALCARGSTRTHTHTDRAMTV